MARDSETFGTALKRFRRREHLTQQELAERAGYSFHYVSMLERGVRLPLPLTVDILADALDLTQSDRSYLQARADSHPQSSRPDAPPVLLPLFGREEEKRRIVALLEQPTVRLITVTGPGGVGKTLLAEHVAAGSSLTFSSGTATIDLAAVDDPSRAVPAIASALLLTEQVSSSPLEQLIARLREREMLLVLDSFERVLSAAPLLRVLLVRCPQLKMLITSRIPLNVSWEQEFPLQPLTLPVATDESHDTLDQNPAVALFMQRARQVKPDIEVNDREMGLVADICRRVDGLPLAIELAAARMAHLPLPVLRDRLDRRLQILTGGPEDAPARQRRMRDTIAWSYDVLEPPDRRLFCHLAVFGGRWSLEAAESVCSAGQPVERVLDGLRSLVRVSLVLPLDARDGEARFRMLDTIQEYAAEQLASDPDEEAVRRRHAHYFVRLAEEAEPALQGRGQEAWYARLERDHDTIRLALRWLLKAGEVECALRLSGAIWRFWQRHGDFTEGRRWLEEGLTLADEVAPAVRAKALWGASWLAYHQGDYARARVLSAVHLEIARDLGDPIGVRNALTGLGIVAIAEGRYADALRPLQDSVDMCEPLGLSWHLATSYLNLGTATMHVGDLRQAAVFCERALALYRELGDELFTAITIEHLGYVSLLQRDNARAAELFRTSLQACGSLREKMRVAEVLEGLAAVRVMDGRPGEAARLIGAAAALRESVGGAPPAFLRPFWQPLADKAAQQLGEAGWQTAWGEGRRMTLDTVLAFALDDVAMS